MIISLSALMCANIFCNQWQQSTIFGSKWDDLEDTRESNVNSSSAEWGVAIICNWMNITMTCWDKGRGEVPLCQWKESSTCQTIVLQEQVTFIEWFQFQQQTLWTQQQQAFHEHCKTLKPRTVTIISADEEYPNNEDHFFFMDATASTSNATTPMGMIKSLICSASLMGKLMLYMSY